MSEDVADFINYGYKGSLSVEVTSRSYFTHPYEADERSMALYRQALGRYDAMIEFETPSFLNVSERSESTMTIVLLRFIVQVLYVSDGFARLAFLFNGCSAFFRVYGVR